MPLDIQNINPVYGQYLFNFLTAAKAAGINPGHIISGYRNTNQQASIWEDSDHGKKYPAAPPGDSMHNYGLATDISSPDIMKLRQFANDHPEFKIYPLPGDTSHFQLAGDQRALMANPPTLPQGQSFDVASIKPFTGGASLFNNNVSTAYSNGVPGISLTSSPTNPNAPAQPAATPTTTGTPAPTSADQPSAFEQAKTAFNSGNYGGAIGAIFGNKDVMGGLSGAFGGGPQQQQRGAPTTTQMNLQPMSNANAIATMAPQYLAYLKSLNQASGRVPGLSLGSSYGSVI